MNLSATAFVVVTVWLLALTGCSDPAAQTQRDEEAVNRGDAPSAAMQDRALKSFESACTGAGGSWQKATKQCGMSAAMCADPGTWNEKIGCVYSTVSAADCGEMSHQGLHMVGGVCALTAVSSEQFDQLGLSGEHR